MRRGALLRFQNQLTTDAPQPIDYGITLLGEKPSRGSEHASGRLVPSPPSERGPAPVAQETAWIRDEATLHVAGQASEHSDNFL
ncbi:hypothetical protein GCM10009651_15790 [Microbacterium natoriense]